MSRPVFVPRWPRTRESSTFVTNEAYREQGDNQGTGDGVFSANVVLTEIRTLNILQRMVDHGGRGEMPREYMTVIKKSLMKEGTLPNRPMKQTICNVAMPTQWTR